MAPTMIFMIVFDALILLGAVILFLRPSFTLKLLTRITPRYQKMKRVGTNSSTS